MSKVIFTNKNGQSIELINSAPFLLLTIDGLGDVDADIQTQKAPFQDGSTFIDSVLNERPIYIQAVIMADDNESLIKQRQYLASVFNPKLGEGILRYEVAGVVRELKAIADNVPAFPSGPENRGHYFQKTIINLICPSPFWVEPYFEINEMAAWIGGMEFLLTLPMLFAEQGDQRTITNVGDVETPVEIEFYGPATTPTISNLTTGEMIKVKKNLTADEKLIINTAFGNKSVTLVDAFGVESNAFHYIDLNSTFWNLVKGDNVIKYETGSIENQAKVLIKFKNRYVGV